MNTAWVSWIVDCRLPICQQTHYLIYLSNSFTWQHDICHFVFEIETLGIKAHFRPSLTVNDW